MSPLKGATGALIFTIIEFVAFACCVIATPVGWFFPETKVNTYYAREAAMGNLVRAYDAKDRSCTTLWGYKPDCNKTKYQFKTNLWGCDHRKNNMISSCVFAIASIVLTLVMLILGALMVLNTFNMKILNIILSGVTLGCILVCWACAVDVYNSAFCKGLTGPNDPGYAWKSFTTIGGGFVLMIIATFLQLINTILAILL